jgi:CIC family chloride channel protein
MSNPDLPFEAPRRLRAFVRAREVSIIVIAAAVGALGGVGVALMSFAVDLLHQGFFGLVPGQRLSAIPVIQPVQALIPAAGGLVLGLSFALLAKWRPESPVDPIEANALRGGRMSVRDSLIVAAQTIWSSGVGASVGLEAGYTQLGSGVASWIGRMFHLRRSDLRLLVGCGAASAIAGAFGSPLGGAFYAFELIIGSYTSVGLAPVGIAALNGYLVVKALSPTSFGMVAGALDTVTARDLIGASLLGVAAALFGIAVMHGVALWERLMVALKLPHPARPMLGGALVGALALITPQVMSSGHGALHVTTMMQLPLAAVGSILLFKAMASIISLGSGFRGGLFFASLLLGALGGRLFAEAINAVWPAIHLDPDIYAMLGLGALSASVVGAPLTMSFIVLESTGDFWLAAAVLIAVIIANLITREMFGYSFATWRFHLRGETIRGASDVGWIRDLSVGRMMRTDIQTVSKDMPIEAFQKAYPLGSATRAVAVDDKDRYAGIINISDAYGELPPDSRSIAPLLHHTEIVLTPAMNVQEAASFDRGEADALAVVDMQRRVIGLLTEAYVLRRYAEESERRRREALGET